MRGGWRRSVIVAGSLSIAVLVVMLLAMATIRAQDERPKLGDTLASVTSLIDTTVADVAAGRPHALIAGSSDLTRADHPSGEAGYTRCRSWRDRVTPSWRGSYGYAIPLQGDAEAARLVQAVWESWRWLGNHESLDWDFAADAAQPFARLVSPHTVVEVTIDRTAGEAVLTGRTECLPTG